MRNLFLLSVLWFVAIYIYAQNSGPELKVFFKSNIDITQSELWDFYSSFNITDNRIIFSANNYKIYAIDKNSGHTDWTFDAGRKTNQLPFFYKNTLITGIYQQEERNSIILGLDSGNIVKTLSLEPLTTIPSIRDSILYGTTIIDGGNILAYDLKSDSILWKRFIADGITIQPYFLNNSIIASADYDCWFEMDYKGQLSDTSFNTDLPTYGHDITCLDNFKFLTHDGKTINSDFVEKYFPGNPDVRVKYDYERTFILGVDKLVILGKNKKILKKIEIESNLVLPEIFNEYMEILKIEDQKVWFFYYNTLVIYDLENSIFLQKYDLSPWNPHQLMMDENKLWLISKNDGQFYGLVLQ